MNTVYSDTECKDVQIDCTLLVTYCVRHTFLQCIYIVGYKLRHLIM